MKIDAIEMTRKIREQIHRETEGMSWPELKAYVEAQIGDFDIGKDEDPEQAAPTDPAATRNAAD